jgi:glycosyltransferase involved in cell wall biosynthesis
MHFSESGNEVTVLSLSKGEIPGVRVEQVGPDPCERGRLAYLIAVPRVRRAIREIRPDIVHAHYAGGYGLVGALANFHPLVISAWGSDVLVIPRSEPVMKWIIRKSMAQADLVTSVAAHMSNSIRALGVTRRIVTLPLGANLDVFRPRPEDAFEPSGLIVSTRSLEPVYNINLLIEALPKVLAEIPSARVLLIGDGSVRQQLELRNCELGMKERVTFTGRLTEGEVASHLSQADVYVSTSLSDGNSVSLNEAMACGAFPVVTDIAANSELVEDGRNGFLVGTEDAAQLADKIIAALRSPVLRRKAAAMNWQLVQQKGSLKVAMEQMETEYMTMLRTASS